MPKNFVRKTFDRWLAHNYARFHHPPRLVLSRKEYFVLEFAGITPKLCCYINKWGMVEIRVIYQGEGWDILTDFDVSERRTSTGQYYCHLCTSPDMFPARAALWVTHSFEPLLAWANEHLHASQWLWLYSSGMTGGSTRAEIKPMENMHAKGTTAHLEDMHAKGITTHLVYACPVVRGEKSHPPCS